MRENKIIMISGANSGIGHACIMTWSRKT
ncbi:3-oxoacyl-ACP reductase, partial [Bacillus cereus]